MEHHRLRKYRGPETWARVKDAYLAGEPAPSVARRFDVGLSNLRRRALVEGWTRKRAAEGLDRALRRTLASRDSSDGGAGETTATWEPVGFMDPLTAVEQAMGQAAWLISEGRMAEALVLIKAADALRQLHALTPLELIDGWGRRSGRATR